MLKIDNDAVLINGKRFGKIMNHRFERSVTYEHDLYRFLNSWTIPYEIILVSRIKFLLFKVEDRKAYAISINKVKQFLNIYNPYISYNKYSNGLKQIAIPICFFDSQIRGEDRQFGIELKEFDDLVFNPRTVYTKWKYRKKAKVDWRDKIIEEVSTY